MFFELHDYNALFINNKIIQLPKRIKQIYDFEKNVVVLMLANKGDKEFGVDIGGNIHCYDKEGNLKWIFPKIVRVFYTRTYKIKNKLRIVK